MISSSYKLNGQETEKKHMAISLVCPFVSLKKMGVAAVTLRG